MAPEADCHLHQQDVWSVFCSCYQGRCAVLGVCALSSWGQAASSLQAVNPIPSVLCHLTQSEVIFLLWFAALNQI